MDNFKLIIFTANHLIYNENALIVALFDAGLEHLHLKKNISINELANLLKNIPANYRHRIVVHINAQEPLKNWILFAKEYNLKGMHLSANMRKNYDKLKNQIKIVSTSCHSIKELKQTKQNYNFEYYFLSPLFDSISKQNYASKYNISDLQNAQKHHIISHDVIALGGINTNNIQQVRELGFGGAAVLGAIW